MNTQQETHFSHGAAGAGKKGGAMKKRGLRNLFISWLLLIGMGAGTTYAYTDYLKKQMEREMARQMEQQLQAVRDDYHKQVSELKDSVSSDMQKMQTKVDSLNDLLAFAKDTASPKTDNGSQLYAQLDEIKKKLDELKKNLDVLQQ